jgi:lauroyl/myristoyl acyltransferase
MKGLCFRCEIRAQFLEEGIQPRRECGMIECEISSCYMFKPVKPAILKKNENDERPQFGGAFISARSSFVKVPKDLELNIKKYKDGNMIYWLPKEKKKRSKEK